MLRAGWLLAVQGERAVNAPSKQRVLVVDDDQDIRESLELLLSDLGYDVLLASDGTAGMARAERDAPDLVILDLMIPYRSGIAVLDSLKGRTIHRVPVIMMSGSTETRHLELAESHGADGWLAKPFDEAHLLGLLHRVLPVRTERPQFPRRPMFIEKETAARSSIPGW